MENNFSKNLVLVKVSNYEHYKNYYKFHHFEHNHFGLWYATKQHNTDYNRILKALDFSFFFPCLLDFPEYHIYLNQKHVSAVLQI